MLELECEERPDFRIVSVSVRTLVRGVAAVLVPLRKERHIAGQAAAQRLRRSRPLPKSPTNQHCIRAPLCMSTVAWASLTARRLAEPDLKPPGPQTTQLLLTKVS